MKTGHLFAGAGGGLYADLILGNQPIFAVEWNDYAATILQERADEGWFPGLHVHHGDVRLFDPSEYAGRVDSLHAGFPCQDISVAGNGAGIEGERSGLWSEVVRVADAIRPGELYLENSPAITSRGLGTVLGDLADLGYDARWCVLPAAAVGAPHLRARWWCLARLADAGCGRRRGTESRQVEQPRRTEAVSAGNAADPDSELLWQQPGRKRWKGGAEGQAKPGNDGKAQSVADAYGDPGIKRRPSDSPQGQGRRDADRGGQQPHVSDSSGARQQEREAHSESESETRRASARKPPERDDWWATEPDVGRVAHGVAHRRHRIEALGNGQVPLQAAAAYVLLDTEMNQQSNRGIR